MATNQSSPLISADVQGEYPAEADGSIGFKVQAIKTICLGSAEQNPKIGINAHDDHNIDLVIQHRGSQCATRRAVSGQFAAWDATARNIHKSLRQRPSALQ
jgi:hypothetical protein